MKYVSTIIIFLSLNFYSHGTMEKKTGESENIRNTVVVTGKITDGDTGEALTGVKIEIEGTEIRSYTDFDGHYRLVIPASSRFRVKYRFITYRPADTELTADAKEGSVNHDAILHRL
jgi:hypothetical protein